MFFFIVFYFFKIQSFFSFQIEKSGQNFND